MLGKVFFFLPIDLIKVLNEDKAAKISALRQAGKRLKSVGKNFYSCMFYPLLRQIEKVKKMVASAIKLREQR